MTRPSEASPVHDSVAAMSPGVRQPITIEQHGEVFRVRLSVLGETHRFTMRGADRADVERTAAAKLEELQRRARRRRGLGSIDRRGDGFRIRLHVGGKSHTFSVKTADRQVAEDAAAARLRELKLAAHRRVIGLSARVTFSELLAHFDAKEMPTLSRGTREAYVDSFRPIREYFLDVVGDPVLEDVQAAHVKEFLAWRRVHRRVDARPTKDGSARKGREAGVALSNRTLQKDRAVLHRLFEFAEQLELREGNPVARVDAPKADTRTPVLLTVDEYERLLTHCAGRPMLALYVLTLGESGVRCESEALHLRFEDVDLEGGYLRIVSGRDGHRTKSGKGRWVPMTPRLRDAMRAHAAAFRLVTYDGARSPWVFHHERTHKRYVAGARIGSLRHSFRAAAQRAKLPAELHQHDLRHRRVTTWLAEGRDVVLVKEALGHSDLRTTMGYTHLAREHLKALVDAPTSKPTRSGNRAR